MRDQVDAAGGLAKFKEKNKAIVVSNGSIAYLDLILLGYAARIPKEEWSIKPIKCIVEQLKGNVKKKLRKFIENVDKLDDAQQKVIIKKFFDDARFVYDGLGIKQATILVAKNNAFGTPDQKLDGKNRKKLLEAGTYVFNEDIDKKIYTLDEIENNIKQLLREHEKVIVVGDNVSDLSLATSIKKNYPTKKTVFYGMQLTEKKITKKLRGCKECNLDEVHLVNTNGEIERVIGTANNVAKSKPKKASNVAKERKKYSKVKTDGYWRG